MAGSVVESKSKGSVKFGLVFLLTMLLASFACIFFSIYLLDDDAPFPSKNAGIVWALVSSFGILFPLLATHFHTMYLHRRMSWFSWWLGIVALFGILLLALGDFLGKEFTSTERQRIFVFYLSLVSASTLGCFAVFAPVRRFMPRLVDYKKPEQSIQQKRFGIKTLLFWTTALAILGAVYSNFEKIGIEMFPNHDYSIPESMLIAMIWGAVLAMLLWLPAIKWFQHFRPYWLSLLSLVFVTALLTMTIIGIITAATFHYERGMTYVVKLFSMQLASLVLITGCWIYGCRLAGLLPATKLVSQKERRSRGFFRKSFSGLNWLMQRALWLSVAVSLIYAVGWSWIHFASGGEEREMKSALKGTLAESENWLDLANEKWGQGVAPEQNVIVGIIKTLNPLGENPSANVYYERLGISIEEQPAPTTQIDIGLDSFDMMGPPDKTYEYQESLRNQLYDRDTGESLQLTGVSEEKRYFMEEMSRSVDFSLFQKAPWDRDMCDPAANFLDEHKTKLAKLRQISTWNQFYSPWLESSEQDTRIEHFGQDVLLSAIDLLQMSAMQHLGNDRIDEAIEDCMAMDRLARPEWISRLPKFVLETSRYQLRKPVETTALQIAFHPSVTSAQLVELLEAIGKKLPNEPSRLAVEVRDAMYVRQGLASIKRTIIQKSPESFKRDHPFRAWYSENSRTVDWESWREAYDEIRSKEQKLINAIHRGEVGIQEKRRRIEALRCFEGINFPKAEFYDTILGHKLFTFVRSPKFKGQILGSIAADRMLKYTSFGIYFGQRDRDFAIIALGLQRWKKQNGSFPDSLDQLVPEFIEAIPKDVIAQQDFIYQKTEFSFLLYGIGSNGIDDGGDLNKDMVFEHPWPNLIEHHFHSRN